jgi:hypothetical protein
MSGQLIKEKIKSVIAGDLKSQKNYFWILGREAIYYCVTENDESPRGEYPVSIFNFCSDLKYYFSDSFFKEFEIFPNSFYRGGIKTRGIEFLKNSLFSFFLILIFSANSQIFQFSIF